MKFSVCIELLFTEYRFVKRIEMAKKFNFDAVEFWDWKEKDIEAIRNECKNNGIEIAAFVGNTKGQMVNPDDNDKFIDGVKESINMAKDLNCQNLILTTNTLREDRSVAPLSKDISKNEKRENIIKVLTQLVPIAEDADVVLNIEPLNVIVDHKGYFLKYSNNGFDILKEISSSNVKLLYDIYHMQIMEGNIISNLINNINLIGHIHIADVPGRHEPGSGELNYKNIYEKLKEIDYKRFIGFEFIPSTSTKSSLSAVKNIFRF